MTLKLYMLFLKIGSHCSLCSLYSWRYDHLGNLPHVLQQREYQLANPGFSYDYQLINVEDFNGVGESEPTPYFYQVCSGFVSGNF